MVKRYSRLAVYEEDHRVIKTAASLRGMSIPEYVKNRLSQDVQETKARLEEIGQQLKEQEQKRDNRRRNGRFGYF